MFAPAKLGLGPDNHHHRRRSAHMQAIAPVFERLSLVLYTERFIENGFETWEDVLDVTESDLDTMQVLRGHRRRLQREIADYKGIPIDQVIVSPGRAASIEALGAGEGSAGAQRVEPLGQYGSVSATGKRRYRRHPKPDANAPERPPSAYVLFSNEVREELKTQNLSFTEMAKVVGERWQQLDTEGREPYESKAGAMKEDYNSKLAEYKRTDEYKEYAEYLVSFKASQANTAKQANDIKRPKLETSGDGSHNSSRGSQGTPNTSAHGSPVAASTASLHSGIADGALVSPSPTSSYQPTYQPHALGRSSLAAVRPAIVGQAPVEQPGPYTAHQPLPPLSTEFAQPTLPRRSDRLPPSFLGRSQDNSTSSGGSQPSSSYSPLTPADSGGLRSSVTPQADSGPPYPQHHGLKNLNLGTFERRSPASASFNFAPPNSSGNPPYGVAEAASRTLPPLNQPKAIPQQQQGRMDGLSVLALAGRLVDGDRDRPDDARPKPP